jgi:peptidoglycan hydrolase-like protein with peptidoglycan-binding domain
MHWLLGIGLFIVALAAMPSGIADAIACPTDRGAPITSPYGWRASTGTWHAGLDIGVNYRPIYAAASGEVHQQWYSGYQITKDLHAGGRVYRYAHLSEGGVTGYANEGANIGQSGNGSGNVDPHLHWEIRTDGGGFGYEGTINPAGEYNSCGGGGFVPTSSGTNPNPTSPVNNPPAPVAPVAPPPNPNDVGSSNCHSLVLRQGNFGGCVRHLQTHLNDFGYWLSLDSDFGPATRSAVRDFQVNRGLDVDGVVGPATWSALHNTAPPPIINNSPDTTDGYKIVGQGSGRCLDVTGESRSNGAAMQIWGCHGRPNQRWRFENGLVKIYDNKCLDVTGYATGDGSRVEIYECHGSSNQQWRYENGMIKIYENKCLDVKAYATHDGAAVEIYECHGGSNQQWSIQQ